MAHQNGVSNEDEVKAEEILVKMGFPSLVAHIYLYILRHSPTSSSSLIRSSDKNNLEASISWLLEKGYMYEENDEDGNKYYFSISPIILAKTLFDDFIWSELRFHEISEEDVGHLPGEEKKKFYEYKKLCNSLTKIFSSKSDRRTAEGLTYIGDQQHLSALLSECIMNASHEIFGVVVPKWTPNLPVVWESLKCKLEAGIKYRRISDELTFLAFGYLLNRRDVQKLGVRLRILESKYIREKFYVIDDRVAVVFWPSLPEFRFDVTLVDNKSLVRIFLQKAEKMWSLGVSADEMLDYVVELRCDFLKRCEGDSATYKIAKEVFDYGIFSKFKSIPLSDREIKEILDNLTRCGLLIRIRSDYYPYGQTGYIPNVRDHILAFIQNRRRQFNGQMVSRNE